MAYRRRACAIALLLATGCADDGNGWSGLSAGSGVATNPSTTAGGGSGSDDGMTGTASEGGEAGASTATPDATGAVDDAATTTADSATDTASDAGDSGTSVGTDPSSDGSTSMPATSDDGGAGCGNGVAEGAEQCDGADLQGQSCSDFDHIGGSLACAANCTVDTSDCGPACGGDGENCTVDTDCCPGSVCDMIFGCEPE